jgi:peptidoglycan/LPS O-acetylase OafA/YrhL
MVKKTLKYRAEIDGLRALAVIPVILYHAGFKLFSGGYVGVDVFFVISGYLITAIILAELEVGPFSLIHFYERRARRILPVLFVVMFACLPFAWFLLTPDAMKAFLESLFAVTTLISNIFFYKQSGYFDDVTELKPLIHTWSLALEEQYYILFPLFLMFTRKLGKRWVVGLLIILFVISLAGAQYLSANHPSFNFFMLPTRVWELLIGAFIAFYYARHNIRKHHHLIEQLGSLFGLLVIASSVFIYNPQTPFPSIYALAPTLGAALIIIFATHKTIVGKLLGSKLFVAIGLISYSAYLWHQPIFAFVREFSLDEPSMYLMSSLVLLSFVFAYLSWRYIETPFRNKDLITRNKFFFNCALCSTFFIVLGVGVKDKVATFSEIQNPSLINQTSIKENNSYLNCTKDIKKYGDADCKVNGEGKRVIVLWGDSHATVLSNNIPMINGALVYVISHPGCPPVIGVRRFDGLGNSISCNNINTLTNYAKFIESLKPETVILVGRWTLYVNGWQRNGILQNSHHFISLENNDDVIKPLAIRQARLEEQLHNTVDYFSKTSNVIILSQPPDYSKYSVNKIKKYNFQVNFSELMKWHRSELEILQGFDNLSSKVIVLDSKKLFCSVGVCNTRSNGAHLYIDDNHLTDAASKKQWEIILNKITKY